jgi:Na+/H+-dicarboxylate symporter
MLFGDVLPEALKSLLLTISLSIKALLLFFLPIIVFSLVFHAFSYLTGNIFGFAALLISLICLSNFLGVIFAYLVGLEFRGFITAEQIISGGDYQNLLAPYFNFTLPKLCDNSIALISGVLLGLYAKVTDSFRLKLLSKKFVELTNTFLQKLFIPIIPLLVAGFILKLQHEGGLDILLKRSSPILVVIVSTQVIYIGSIYWISNNFNLAKTIGSIKNILPATIVGFSTMSSAASMPALTAGTLRNAQDQKLVQSIIPSAINTHMLGDALAIPIMAISLYLMQYNQMPELNVYLKFAFAYVLAKFSAAGVPGGTVLIMIPVLESNLQFTSEMSASILMMYILFDCFCTMFNILGNGALAIIFEKLWRLK